MNNIGRELVKEKVLMIGSKDIDTISNLNVYDTYNDLYLSETEREEKLLQGIQSANGLKAWVGAKKADGTTLTETTQENAIKKTFDKRFAIPLNFDRVSDISLEYNVIFNEAYATSIGEMYTGTTSIPYTKVTSIYYQTLSKKGTTWKIGVNSLSVCSLQGLL